MNTIKAKSIVLTILVISLSVLYFSAILSGEMTDDGALDAIHNPTDNLDIDTAAYFQTDDTGVIRFVYKTTPTTQHSP